MSTLAQYKLAKKLIAVLGKEDAIELVKHIPAHSTGGKHKASDLLNVLETPSQELLQNYLNSGIECLVALQGLTECLNKENVKIEVSQSQNYATQFDIDIRVPTPAALVAELQLDKIKEQLRRLFRVDSCPIKNASLGKVSIVEDESEDTGK